MGQIQKVFNRYEKKFLLDENTYNSLKRELDEYMLEVRAGGRDRDHGLYGTGDRPRI